MNERIKNDVQEIAQIVSSLLLYLDDLERLERERASSPVIRLFKQEDENMARFKDGSFRQRGKRLEYRFMLGGKQRAVLGATKDECYAKREDAIRLHGKSDEKPVTAREVMTLLSTIGSGQGSNAAGSSELFGEWLQHWYQTYKRPHVKGHTRRLYERLIAELATGDLGSTPLNAVTGEQLQLYLNAETHENKRTKLTHLLRPALSKAVKEHMLAFNPFDSVELPGHKGRHRPAFTFDQQTAILAEIEGKYAAAFWVLNCTGLRIGEFLGLEYRRDVDYKACTIKVHDGVDIISGERINSTKTEKGVRVIRFLPSLVPYLKRCESEPLTYNMLRLYFSRLFKRLGYAGCSLYCCRHTFITLCAYVGIAPQYIQKLAGHASIVTTFDVYTDAIDPGTSPLLPYFEALAKIYPKMK